MICKFNLNWTIKGREREKKIERVKEREKERKSERVKERKRVREREGENKFKEL